MPRLRNKVIAITGASGGIGRATALMLAQRGAKLVLGGRRVGHLAALADDIATAGGHATFIGTGGARPADVAGLVSLAVKRYGRLDVLINNGGISPRSVADEGQSNDWDGLVEANLADARGGMAAALRIFRAQGRGHFVNVLSSAGLRIVPMQGVYATARTAVQTMSDGLRLHAGPNLHVTVLSPGFVHRDLADGITMADIKPQAIAARDKMAISAATIARAITFAIEQRADGAEGMIIDLMRRFRMRVGLLAMRLSEARRTVSNMAGVVCQPCAGGARKVAQYRRDQYQVGT